MNSSNSTTFTENFNISLNLHPEENYKPLIKINTDETGRPTVNARDLHVFLEVGKIFPAWMQDRINKYDFVENQDFVCVPVLESKGRGGHNKKEYYISIDMAKELSMVERNEKGKQARQYFIECERRTKDPMIALSNPAALRQTLLTYTERVIALEETVNAQAPKVAALDRISTADGSMNITAAAKHLQVRPKELFAHLVENKWIYRRNGNKSYLAYQNRIQQGVMEHKVSTQITSDGIERVYEQARVTPKGLAKLSEALSKALV